MQDRVLKTITRFGMLAPGQRVGVAVSGGADSVCLLHLLHELAPRWTLRLSVIHVDHGIRGAASHEDARFVQELAECFGLPFHLKEADVPAMGGNLEQTARDVRQETYLHLLRAGLVDRIATGHTRSDQAETVLYRFLRGSGLAGLSGILPITREGLVRPLLYVTRTEVRNWLRDNGISWREDESNQDRSYVRNRIRHELLPQLRSEFNPGLDEVLANTAEVTRDENEWLRTHVPPLPSGGVLRVSDLQNRAAGRRLVRQAIEAVRGDLRQIGFEHVEEVLDMAAAKAGHGRVQVPGAEIVRSFDRIRVGTKEGARPEFCVSVQVPGSVELPDGSGRIDLRFITVGGESPQMYDILVHELDWLNVTSRPAQGTALLELRNWRPGDQYRRVGDSHERKIKSLFQQARVPSWDRQFWPILTFGGRIVWARRFGPAADAAAAEASRTILRIIDSPANRL